MHLEFIPDLPSWFFLVCICRMRLAVTFLHLHCLSVCLSLFPPIGSYGVGMWFEDKVKYMNVLVWEMAFHHFEYIVLTKNNHLLLDTVGEEITKHIVKENSLMAMFENYDTRVKGSYHTCFKSIYYLKGRETESFHQLVHSVNAITDRADQAKARVQKLSLGLLHGCRNPNTWFITCCLSELPFAGNWELGMEQELEPAL